MPDDRYGADVLSRKRNRRAVPEVVAEPGPAGAQVGRQQLGQRRHDGPVSPVRLRLGHLALVDPLPGLGR